MAKMIQVRNVRPEVHDELVRRAKIRGKTLTAYIEGMLEREVSRPDPEEVFARIKSRRPVPFGKPAAEIIRELRDEEEERWDQWWSTRRPSSTT